MLLVYPPEPYGAVRSSGLGQSFARGVALDVQETGHSVTAEVADTFEVLVGCGNAEVSRVLFDLDDLDDLVLWPLHVELHLRVLVGRPHGPMRRGALALLA